MATIANYHAGRAYDTLADKYDMLTADYDYARWLGAIEGLARTHGLCGRRLLDAACGTGKSFAPLLERGYEVTGFDISPEMLDRARRPGAELFVGDLRQVGRVGSFDLITCLDDALNHLHEPEELLAALRGFRRNLAPRGIAVWDVNTLAMYRSAFARDEVTERDGVLIAWRGGASPLQEPGSMVDLTIDVFADTGACWSRCTSLHVQRHWPASGIADLAVSAGLRILDVRGQHPGAVIDGRLDELTHTKALFVACRDDRPDKQGGET